MRDINSTSRAQGGRPWPQKKQAQLITMHSYDFQTKVVQSKCCLFAIVCCSMAKINNLWAGSMLQAQGAWSGVPWCGQDGYRAQVPQQPTDSSNIYLCSGS